MTNWVGFVPPGKDLMQIKEAMEQKCSAFQKQLRDPYWTKALKSVSGNRKMGGGESLITVGRWEGREMLQLSLEERATCPVSCPLNKDGGCYGDRMHTAHRIDHRNPGLLMSRIGMDLANAVVGGVPVVRLHVLGDFFSLQYAQFWHVEVKMGRCSIFGFTAHAEKSLIGNYLRDVNRITPEFRMRFSHDTGPWGALVAGVSPGWDTVETIRCPHELYGLHCKDCGICWEVPTPVLFTYHGRETYQKEAQQIAKGLR